MTLFGHNITRVLIPSYSLSFSLFGFLLTRELNPSLQSIEGQRYIVMFLLLINLVITYFFGNRAGKINRSNNVLTHQRHVTKPIDLQYIILIIITSACWLISTLKSTPSNQYLIPWTENVLFIGYFLCLWHYLRAQNLQLPLLLSVRLLIWPITLCYGLMWSILDNPNQYNWITKGPLILNIRHLGHIVFMIFCAALLTLSFRPRIQKIHINILFVELFLCWFFIFWMGGRAVFLATSFIFVSALIALARYRYTLIVIPIAAFAVSRLFLVEHTSMDLFRLLSTAEGVPSINTLSSNRWFLWSESIYLWWQKGFWWGHGADAFLRLIGEDISGRLGHPHNWLINLLLSYGVIGTLTLLALPTYYLYKYSQDVTKKEGSYIDVLRFQWVAQRQILLKITVYLGLLFIASLSGSLYHSYSLWLCGLVFICTLSFKQNLSHP